MANEHKSLTPAQAEQVAQRLNPQEDQSIYFSVDGSVLHTEAERSGAMASGEIYRAFRSAGVVGVEVCNEV